MPVLFRWLLLSAWAAMLGGCDNSSVNAPNTSEPASTIPSGRIPPASVKLSALAGDMHITGIASHLVGPAEDQLLVLDIDQDVMEPVLIGNPQSGISVRNAMSANNLSLIIGSGFVSDLNSLQPVGLLQIDGQTLSQVQGHGYTRIIGINDSGMGVVHRKSYQSALFHSALQAGPGIVERGRLDISERDLQRPQYFRSFLALCENRWLAGVSLQPTHLRTLGQTLLSYIDAQGWQCSDVVNLAGDREAVMMLRTGAETLFYHGDPDLYKVSVIGFKFRADN
jgi:hypothetical protein